MSSNLVLVMPISCPWYMKGIPRNKTIIVPSILVPWAFLACSGRYLLAPLGSSWFSIMFDKNPTFSLSFWALKIAFLYCLNVKSGASYQPCPPKDKHWAEKSNIDEKWPFSPINSPSSSFFMLNTSPTVNASCFSKVFFFKFSSMLPMPVACSATLPACTSPSSPSGSRFSKFKSFAMLIMASILKPETPLSSHQFIIL